MKREATSALPHSKLFLLAFLSLSFNAPVLAYAAFGDGSPTAFGSDPFTGQSTSLRVDGSTGAFTQNVPINIPPGRNGIQPALSLNYNSQNTSDSMVGYGWNLSIPYITRFNKTGTQDLYINPAFTSSLDGELVQVATSSQYLPRVDTGGQNTYFYSGNIWTVYDKKGTRYTFGGTDGSRQYDTGGASASTYKWMLQEIRDTTDNYATFTYAHDGNEIYPQTILYTGRGSTNGPFQISFATSTRPDIRTTYSTGFPVTLNWLISEIDISASGNLVGKYTLSYGTGSNNKRSLLTSIQQTGYDESATATALPAMSFGYASSSTMFLGQSDTQGGNGLSVDGPTSIVSDVNGNGINDVSSAMYNVDTGALYKQLYIDQGGYSQWYQSANLPDYWDYKNSSNAAWPGERGVRFLDINGDGKADLIQAYKDDQAHTATTSVEYINSYPSGGYNWTSTTTYTGVIPAFGYTKSDGTVLTTGILGDVNADGLADFVMSLGGYTGTKTYLGNQSAFATSTSFTAIRGMPSSASSVGDASQLTDINGDGLADWVYSDDSRTYVRLNNGIGWEGSAATQWGIATSTYYKSSLGGTDYYYDRGMRFQDINGDGLPDFIRAYSMGPNSACSATPPPEYADLKIVLLNTGNGWATSTAYTLPGYITAGWINSGGVPCGPLALRHNEYANWIGNGQMDQDVITSVTYPTGGYKNVTYVPSAQLGGNQSLPISLLVATAIGEYDGFGGAATTTYAYSGGKIYTAGGAPDRKFAGFSVATTTAPDSVTATYFSQGTGLQTSLGEQTNGYPQIGKPFRKDLFDLSSNLTQRTYYRWDSYPSASSTFLGLGEQLTLDYGSGGSHQDAATTYLYSTSSPLNNLIRTTEYGQVIGSSDGTFTDTGSDRRITDSLYAATTTTATTTNGTPTNGNSVSIAYSSHQYGTVADNAALSVTGNITAEVWIKPTATDNDGNNHYILSKANNSNTSGVYFLRVSQISGHLELEGTVVNSGSTNCYAFSSGANLENSIGTWIHVAMAWTAGSGNYPKLFVNGVETSYGASGTGCSSIQNSDGDFVFGALYDGGSSIGQYWDGKIDDMRIWNIARSAADLASDMSTELVGTESGLVGYWKLNGNPNDTTSNGSTLDLHGVPPYPTDVPFSGLSPGTSTLSYVITLPSQETLVNQSGTQVKQTRHYYDTLALGNIGSKGNETATENWISGSAYASSTRIYSAYGLVASSTDPRGNVTTNTYDPFNLYVATSTNAFGQKTQYYYDYTSGKPKQTIDQNGFVFQTAYDGLDRPLTESQPDLITPTTLVTKKAYAYTDTIGSRAVAETNYLDASNSFAVYKYFDGLDRPIQTRKQAETSGQFSVTDFAYNSAGLLQKSSLPYFSSGSSRTAATSADTLYTTYAYDALKRVLTAANAVGTTTTGYDAWSATTTDAIGNPKGFLYDAFKRLSSVLEYNNGTSPTRYTYDAADNLTKVTDASSNIRNFTYDGRGNRLTAEDLHASGDGTFGTWTYVYDDAGNLASTTDPNGKQIGFLYDHLNRAKSEDLVGQAGKEIQYDFDGCTNGKGRLCVATSTGAVSSFTYNALGLIATESKNIASTTYNTSYSYDRQGNLTDIVYPDNSETAYTYNGAGLLESVKFKENGGSFGNVVSNFDYAPNEKVSYKAFGNGVTSAYTYDPNALYRLTNIYTNATTTIPSGGLSFAGPAWSNFARAIENLPWAMKMSFRALFAEADIPTEGSLPPNDEALDLDAASSSPVDALPVLLSEDASTSEPILPDVSLDTDDSTLDDLTATTTEEQATTTEEALLPEEESEVVAPSTPSASEIEVWKWGGEEAVAILYDTAPASEVRSYPLPAKEGMEKGGLEVELVLSQKPDTNAFDFAMKGADNLDFLYQAALDQEKQDPEIASCTPTECVDAKGNVVIERSEDVVGSYAVYEKGKKVFHIFRPKITDAKGQEVWGTLSYADGKLTVQVPQEFLDAATYPVIVDPTFGYGTAGATVVTINNDAAYGIIYPLSDTGVSVSKLTLYGKVGSAGSRNLKGLLYADNGSSYPGTLLASTTAVAVSTTTAAWQDLTFSTPVVLGSSGNYWLGFVADATSTPNVKLYFDTGATNQRYARADSSGDYAAPPNPYPAGATGSAKEFSIYATYTVNPTSTPLGTIQNISFTYDAVGNITSVNETAGTGLARSVAYGYDNLYRLTTASTTAASSTPYRTQFSYDALGSLVGLNNGTGTTTYSYAGTGYANPHAATSIGGVNYSYDKVGNLTNFASTSESWDFKNRLIATYASSSPSTFYTYDHTMQRVSVGDGTSTTTYPNMYYNISSATTTRNIMTPTGDLFATVTKTATTTSEYIHPDWLGGTNVETDHNGILSKAIDYYPYGSDRINTGTAAAQRTYINRERDVTGNLYLQNRYYSSDRGQFLSEDPVFWEVGKTKDGKAILADPQLANSYSYARDNPIVKKDADGRSILILLDFLNAASTLSDLKTFNEVVWQHPEKYSEQQINSAGNKILVDLWLGGLGKVKGALTISEKTTLEAETLILDAVDPYRSINKNSLILPKINTFSNQGFINNVQSSSNAPNSSYASKIYQLPNGKYSDWYGNIVPGPAPPQSKKN